ncbi:sensor histidine kinase [Roseomonas elaeocarpi]|uniref:histidine kinase n=1 Tax=Roseomonas elaeocarpi TaxID=907779 RepID=A0ABV6JN17_9PROT
MPPQSSSQPASPGAGSSDAGSSDAATPATPHQDAAAAKLAAYPGFNPGPGHGPGTADQTGALWRQAAFNQGAAGALHDFNNLLQVVLGAFRSIDGQLGTAPTHKIRDLSSQGLCAAQRAASLSRGLLTREPVRSGTGAKLELAGFLRSIVPKVAMIAGGTVDVRLEHRGGPVLVSCSADEMEDALLNLAVNARDAMAAAGTLTIRAELVSVRSAFPAPCEHHVRISVSDTGSGMSEAVKARAFERHFTTKGQGGSGIGLAAVKEFVERNGGDVWISSSPGQGTIVALALPCEQHIDPVPTCGAAPAKWRALPAP